ncbi:MAG: hydrogenase-1 expression HyaE [Rhodospirillales bacterium]|nr:hydrogenase-1 expression HyaE [Rhodospirillales bacterium]
MTYDLSTFSPLARRIIETEGFPVVGADALDPVCAALPFAMLFLAGDASRLSESDDAAVILVELHKLLGDRVTPLVAAREDERAFHRRFRFTAFPALVFLRDGQYLGCIERVLDWQDYLLELPAILGRAPHEPPPFRLPAHCAPSPVPPA